MSQAGRDARSESGENYDNFALFAPRDELPTIAGGNRVRVLLLTVACINRKIVINHARFFVIRANFIK